MSSGSWGYSDIIRYAMLALKSSILTSFPQKERGTKRGIGEGKP